MFSLLYRVILRGCPPEVREEIGGEMEGIARWLAGTSPAHTRALAYSRGLCDLIIFVVAARRYRNPRLHVNRRPRVWKLNQDIRSDRWRAVQRHPASPARYQGPKCPLDNP